MERVDYTGQPNSFDWLDSTNVGKTFSNFADGEPDNSPDLQHCGVFYTICGLWRSEKCTPRPFLCQRPPGKYQKMFFILFPSFQIHHCKYVLHDNLVAFKVRNSSQ